MRARRIAAVALAAVVLASCSTYRLGEQVASDARDLDGGPIDLPEELAAAGTAPDGDVLTLPGLDDEADGTGGADGTGPGGSGGGSGPVGNDTAGTEPRVASDRGVTPDTLKLGILTVAEDSLGDLGVSYEGRRIEEIIKPFIDEVNAAGGINGRQVVPAVTRFNPASVDSMLAACVAQAEDQKVFATLALLAFYGEGEVCLANKETPTLTPSNSSEHTLYDRERGWVRQTTMNKDRGLKNWIDWIVASGTADRATRIGVVFTDVPEDRQVMQSTVLPHLDALGLNVVEVATFTISTLDAMVSEAQRAAFRFKASGVELVLPVTNFLQFYLFIQQADLAGYVPRYTVTDFGGIASDAVGFYPPSQWEGVTGITSGIAGQPLRNGIYDTPGAQECLAVYNAAGLRFRPDANDASLPDGIEVANMLTACQHVALFADAARRAGANPTRQSFLDAVGNTGRWSHRVTLSPPLFFRPDRYDSLDQFAVIRWQSRCNGANGCYRRVEGFRTGRW